MNLKFLFRNRQYSADYERYSSERNLVKFSHTMRVSSQSGILCDPKVEY